MISGEFLKGSLKTIILKVIKEEGPMHGYAIAQKIEKITNGKLKLSYSALYPILHKLKKDKALVTATDITTGRMRVHYGLTPKGTSMVTEKIKEMKDFITILQQITDLKADTPGPKTN